MSAKPATRTPWKCTSAEGKTNAELDLRAQQHPQWCIKHYPDTYKALQYDRSIAKGIGDGLAFLDKDRGTMPLVFPGRAFGEARRMKRTPEIREAPGHAASTPLGRGSCHV